ncbi:uncharacterized protein EAF01_011254 [Botrytis porri]|uniref:uncharacterized protein n=1 Tax=Botrytis porri TaxID=87229 RepID=UPI0018FFF31A|nr:uncharacterized protein EAF01_011254 [Botrytis porri]KAF7886576.1 hypothetical protein EAF01_011254 [Botrytis porri]
MNPLNATQVAGTDRIILIAEPEEGNAVVLLDQNFLLGDDLQIQLSNTEEIPDLVSYSPLPVDVADRLGQEAQETQNEYIAVLQKQRSLERINMPTSSEKKDKIRELMKPVKGNTDELSPCFCNEPYADETAEVDNNSHESVKMPDCTHIFEKCCIVQWLGDNSPSTCPMCRKVVHLPRDRLVRRNDTDDLYSIIDYHQ